MQLVGQAAVDYSVAHGVTMVMVTEIKPGSETAYKDWADRIQKLQATFPDAVNPGVDGVLSALEQLRIDDRSQRNSRNGTDVGSCPCGCGLSAALVGHYRRNA